MREHEQGTSVFTKWELSKGCVFSKEGALTISNLSQISNGGSVVLMRPESQLHSLRRPVRLTQRITLFLDNWVGTLVPEQPWQWLGSKVGMLNADFKGNRCWATSYWCLSKSLRSSVVTRSPEEVSTTDHLDLASKLSKLCPDKTGSLIDFKYQMTFTY